MNKYAKWIQENYPTPESARLQCEEATKKMAETFPELKRVRGLAHVLEPYGLPPTKTPHWWCVNVYGYEVDPTGHQYPTCILKREPVDESKGEPTGKCIECGDLAYNGSNFCCKEHEQSFIKSLGE